MSNPEDETPENRAGLIVGGSVAALRELADPPRLSDSELNIISWYDRLVRLLSGPTTGDERGPAKQPPWVRQPPQIKTAGLVAEETPAVLIDGSGFATTREVWVDRRPSGGWQILSDRRLLVPITGEFADEVEIVVRTLDGDAVTRVDISADTVIE
jgi:hypothetical protein